MRRRCHPRGPVDLFPQGQQEHPPAVTDQDAHEASELLRRQPRILDYQNYVFGGLVITLIFGTMNSAVLTLLVVPLLYLGLTNRLDPGESQPIRT
ncbi:MAG: hypothetical protein ABFR65_03195 [Pseudomonadota bacterium]